MFSFRSQSNHRSLLIATRKSLCPTDPGRLLSCSWYCSGKATSEEGTSSNNADSMKKVTRLCPKTCHLMALNVCDLILLPWKSISKLPLMRVRAVHCLLIYLAIYLAFMDVYYHGIWEIGPFIPDAVPNHLLIIYVWDSYKSQEVMRLVNRLARHKVKFQPHWSQWVFLHWFKKGRISFEMVL